MHPLESGRKLLPDADLKITIGKPPRSERQRAPQQRDALRTARLRPTPPPYDATVKPYLRRANASLDQCANPRRARLERRGHRCLRVGFVPHLLLDAPKVGKPHAEDFDVSYILGRCQDNQSIVLWDSLF